MKNQIDIRWLIRYASLLLGLNLAITGGIALAVILAIVFK
jgi:hypothetical protein